MTVAVAVLGAGGFVGREVLRSLVPAHRVVAVTRRPLPAAPGVESRIVADGDWRRAVAGADVVIHLIARTHHVGETSAAEPAYRQVNVELTGAVVAACAAEGVRRLVYMSSVKAMGESRAAPYTEDDVCRPVDAYGRTKLEAEDVVRAAPLETVVLRPPLVYGPGATGNIARLVAAIRRGIPLPLGRARAPRSLIAVDNLADAVRVVAEAPQVVGRTYLVSDDELLSVRALVELLAQGTGRRAHLLPVPVPVLRAAGLALRRVEEVDRLVLPLTVDCRRIRGEVGWSPPISAYDALPRVAR